MFTPTILHKALDSLVDLQSKALDSLTEIPAKAIDAVTVNPVEWLTDILLGWKEAALYWSGQVSLYGVVIWFGLRLMGRLFGRKPQEPIYTGGPAAATWLRWRVLNYVDIVGLVNKYDPTGQRMKPGEGNIILVNAWDSGNAARALGAMGIQYSEVI